VAGLEKRRRILLPASFVEIHCEEEAGFVLQHRVYAGDKRLAVVSLAR
jgi:hypothetical protein